jgi:FkbM family methyltransferase
MSDVAQSPHAAAYVPPPPTRTVSLGRRLNTAPWPAPLSALRSGARKLAWTAFEARQVRSPLRYAFHELIAPQLAEYQLRQGSGRISVRHRSGDIDIFRKFYAYGYYDWPAEVRAELTELGRAIHVLDLGANIGFFDVHARDQFAISDVVCFEPDPANAGVLERVRDANGGNWEIVRACASNREGQVMFTSGRHNFSRIEVDGDHPVPAVDVFPYVAKADLVKMNIEGSEWEILQDDRLADCSAVWIVEYHRIRNPAGDITTVARNLFERAGYATRVAVSHGDNGLMWAWRDDRAPLPAAADPVAMAAGQGA